MYNWIINNKEWVLSGIGVLILNIIGTLLFKLFYNKKNSNKISQKSGSKSIQISGDVKGDVTLNSSNSSNTKRKWVFKLIILGIPILIIETAIGAFLLNKFLINLHKKDTISITQNDCEDSNSDDSIKTSSSTSKKTISNDRSDLKQTFTNSFNPSITKPQNNVLQDIQDIRGTWFGYFKNSVRSMHYVMLTLYLNNENKRIDGKMTVKYYHNKNQLTYIEEELKGTINSHNIKIKCYNFNKIKIPYSNYTYYLDSLDLRIDDNNQNIMKGDTYDTIGYLSKINIYKITNSFESLIVPKHVDNITVVDKIEMVYVKLNIGLNKINVINPPVKLMSFDLIKIIGSQHEILTLSTYNKQWKTTSWLKNSPFGYNFPIEKGNEYQLKMVEPKLIKVSLAVPIN